VGAGGALGTDDVLDALTQLVEKSLVILDPPSGRYRMLETVRQYAEQRLEEAGETNETRERHLRFHLDFGEKALSHLFGPDQGDWLARLDVERENLLAAHAWCERAPDGAALDLRLVHSMKAYLLNRGFGALAHRLMLEALARPGAKTRDAAHARACFDAGQTCCFMGRYVEAKSLLEECLAIARELRDEKRVAAVLQPLGMALLGQGDAAAARRCLEEALVLARKQGDRREIAAALIALAQLTRAEGALDPAEPLYEEATALARELGDRESIAIGLLDLAMVAIGRGAMERARRMLVEVLDVVVETRSKPVGQSLLEVCAGLAAATGEHERAARFYGVAEAQNASTAMRRDPADEAFLLPLVDVARAALGSTAFEPAERAGRALSYDDALDEARLYLDARR
jgi:non-specific serine/threonine protein kinase